MSAVVMLHGWGTHASIFDTLARRLSARYAVSAYDLPGYGAARSCTARTLDALAEVIAARAPRRCHVVGWSLGAQIALAWARARPAQVERLALIAATPCFVERADWAFGMEAAVFDAYAASLANDARGALTRFASLQAEGDDDARPTMKRLRAALGACPEPEVQVLQQGLRVLRETDLRPGLRAVEQDALIVHGERDGLVPRAAADYLVRALPRARLAVLPGAAHAPFVSQPERVSARVLEFFDER